MKSITSIFSVEGLGATVRRVRKYQSITQMELARIAGVSRSFIIELEDGHQRAELGKVLVVLDALEISLAALTPESDPAMRKFVSPNRSGHGFTSRADALKDVESSLSGHRIQHNISLQQRAREQRARAMSDITRGWSEGRGIPDRETQRIVLAYIDGLLSLDEAMSKVKKLSESVR